jgi:hypothetical protein
LLFLFGLVVWDDRRRHERREVSEPGIVGILNLGKVEIRGWYPGYRNLGIDRGGAGRGGFDVNCMMTFLTSLGYG